jgi:hypothetical protein
VLVEIGVEIGATYANVLADLDDGHAALVDHAAGEALA